MVDMATTGEDEMRRKMVKKEKRNKDAMGWAGKESGWARG